MVSSTLEKVSAIVAYEAKCSTQECTSLGIISWHIRCILRVYVFTTYAYMSQGHDLHKLGQGNDWSAGWLLKLLQKWSFQVAFVA